MRYNYKSILDQSWPGLPMSTLGVAQQGTCRNYATAKYNKNKRRKKEGK